jgi:hypothetical protein
MVGEISILATVPYMAEFGVSVRVEPKIWEQVVWLEKIEEAPA